MNIETLKSLYINYCGKFSEEEAFEKLADKYPEMIGDLCVIRNGEDELPAEMKFQADETFFDEQVIDLDTEVKIVDAETAVEQIDEEVNVEETPKVEKVEKVEKDVKESKPKKEKKVNVDKQEKAPSKAELARQIYASATDRSRSAITKVFIEKLGLTAAGASTYMQNCKKWFESQQEKA